MSKGTVELSNILLDHRKSDSSATSNADINLVHLLAPSSSPSSSPLSDRNSNENEDSDAPGADIIGFDALRFSWCREILYWLLALCTGFFSLLFARWLPQWFAPFRYERCSPSEADFILVTVQTCFKSSVSIYVEPKRFGM